MNLTNIIHAYNLQSTDHWELFFAKGAPLARSGSSVRYVFPDGRVGFFPPGKARALGGTTPLGAAMQDAYALFKCWLQ